MATAEAVRQVLADRLLGVLREEIAAEPGSAEELSARLQEHPAFEAALVDLRAAARGGSSSSGGSIGGGGLAIGGGGAELGRPTTSQCGDGGRPKTVRPKTVVWAFDSDSGSDSTRRDSGGSGSAGSGSGSAGSGSGSAGACSPRDPFGCEWGGAVLDDLYRLAAQMAAAGPEPQRQRALAELAAHPAQDVLSDQHWAAVLKGLGACLVDAAPTVRRAAADELCLLLAAALPGSPAFDVITTLGEACRESLCRSIPLDELAARASLLARALAAVSGSWEQLSEGQSETFVATLCALCATTQPSSHGAVAEAGAAAARPSMLALMGLVDSNGMWARRILARLGMRHALLAAFLDESILEEYLALLQDLPSFLKAYTHSAGKQGADGDVSASDWRLLEVVQPLLFHTKP
jgi:hypothetical protein